MNIIIFFTSPIFGSSIIVLPKKLSDTSITKLISQNQILKFHIEVWTSYLHQHPRFFQNYPHTKAQIYYPIFNKPHTLFLLEKSDFPFRDYSFLEGVGFRCNTIETQMDRNLYGVGDMNHELLFRQMYICNNTNNLLEFGPFAYRWY